MDISQTHYTQRTCLNGHIISNYANSGIDDIQEWCDECGAATIEECPSCSGPLKGASRDGLPGSSVPASYCIHCGKALPWTKSRFDAIREIANYIDTFNSTDRDTLQEIMPDLITKASTPKTELAIVKMKSLLKKGGSAFAESARKILVDVTSEVVKKALFPQP